MDFDSCDWRGFMDFLLGSLIRWVQLYLNCFYSKYWFYETKALLLIKRIMEVKWVGFFVSCFVSFKSHYKTLECQNNCSHVCLVHVLLGNAMKTNTVLAFLRISWFLIDDELQLHPCLQKVIVTQHFLQDFSKRLCFLLEVWNKLT